MLKFQNIPLLNSQHCSIIGDKSQQGCRREKIILFFFHFFLFFFLFLWIIYLETDCRQGIEFPALSQKIIPRYCISMLIIYRLNVFRHKNMATVHSDWCQLPEYSASVMENMQPPPHSSLPPHCPLSPTTFCSLYFNISSHYNSASNSYLGYLWLYFQIKLQHKE